MCCLWKQPGGMRRVHVCYTKGRNLKINCRLFHDCRNLTPWHWSLQCKRAKTSRSRSEPVFDSSRAAPGVSAFMNSKDAGSEAALIDSLLLRPFLLGYSHEAELSNATSYYRTSFATLLPKKCSISLYPFYWHKRCYRPTRAVQTHHFMYKLQRWSTSGVNSGIDVTFTAYLRRFTKVVHYILDDLMYFRWHTERRTPFRHVQSL